MPQSPPFYKNNRKQIQKNLKGNEIFVISAAARLQKSADTTFFAQDTNFLYLSGINESDWILCITSNEEFLIEPRKTKTERLFDGGLTADDAAGISGVRMVISDTEGWSKLGALVKAAKEIQVAAHDEKLWFRTIANPAQNRLVRRLKSRGAKNIVSIHPKIHAQRAIKQSEEISAIKRAIRITAETLSEVKLRIDKYNYEYEVEADITAGFISRGSAGHAFEPIVASGNNANIVHYIENDQPLDKNGLLLIDIGASYQGYAADITRCYSLGEPTDRQIAVHSAIDYVREQAIKMIKPGLKFSDYYKAELSFMGQELKKLGLITNESVKEIRRYYPYGGHLLGLDIHDVNAGSEEFLEGMVLTVEPGIHIPDEKIGVRIEDDVLVTKNGATNLSRDIPREL